MKKKEIDLNGEKTLVVSESGIYGLFLFALSDNNKKVKKWITSDVIPSIRKKCSIAKDQQISKYDVLREISKEIEILDDTIENLKRETRRVNSQKEEKYKELRALILSDDNQMTIEFEE